MVIPSHFILFLFIYFIIIIKEVIIISCGIYKITNIINGHSYIGLSKDIEKRWQNHIDHLNSKKEFNKALYKAMRKYGLENFIIEILEECPEDNEILKERERYWISYYNTYNDREQYNETPGGDLPGYNTIHLGQNHGMAKLTDEEVRFCRLAYKEGKRSRDIYEQSFSDKISYSGFLNMWHGTTWKHIMPEVFECNPHKGKYTEEDCKLINELFQKSNLSLRAFVKTDECFVGYGTAYKMIHTPEFYKNK